MNWPAALATSVPPLFALTCKPNQLAALSIGGPVSVARWCALGGNMNSLFIYHKPVKCEESETRASGPTARQMRLILRDQAKTSLDATSSGPSRLAGKVLQHLISEPTLRAYPRHAPSGPCRPPPVWCFTPVHRSPSPRIERKGLLKDCRL